jgi:hypothetical protein
MAAPEQVRCLEPCRSSSSEAAPGSSITAAMIVAKPKKSKVAHPHGLPSATIAIPPASNTAQPKRSRINRLRDGYRVTGPGKLARIASAV